MWAAPQPLEFRMFTSGSRSRSRSGSSASESSRSVSPQPQLQPQSKRFKSALEDVLPVAMEAMDATWATVGAGAAEAGPSDPTARASLSGHGGAGALDMANDTVDVTSLMPETLTDSSVSPHSSAAPTATAAMETRISSWLDQLANHANVVPALLPAAAAGASADNSSPSSEEEGSVLELMREQQGQLLAGSGSGAMIDPSLLLLGAGQPLFSALNSTGRININPAASSSSLHLPDLPSLSSLAPQPSFNMSASTLAMRRGVIPPSASSMMLRPAADPIAAAYPSENGRRLFNHFFSLTSVIVIAMGTKHKDKGKNPFLGVSVPLIVCDIDSPAQTALRLGVLSLAATHLHHQYLEAGGAEQAAQMYEETQRAKRQAVAHMMLSLSKEGDRHIDLLLAACMTLKTRDVSVPGVRTS